jgi:hypothetical protein
MGLHKIIKIIAWLFGIAGIASLVLILMEGNDAIKAAAKMGDTGSINPMYTVAVVILILVLAVVLIFVLKGIFTGDIKKTLISVGAFLAVIIIAYVLASDSIVGLPEVGEGEEISASGSKWVGTGLIAFYILAITAIGAMLFHGAKKIISK